MTLKAHRERRGLSQRELARRAGVAYKTVQLLEEGGHDSRWSTLAKLAKALNLTGPEALSRGEAPRGLSLAETADRIREYGEEYWKLFLFEFVDAFRRHPDPDVLRQPPNPDVGPRILALLASTVEFLCYERGMQAPWWCAGAPPLQDPWFVAETESLKATSLVESPAGFRKRNIFVLGNFLIRA